MNREKWHKIEAIVVSALELPNSERRVFLSESCGEDADLRREVESLLAHGNEDFLEPEDFESLVVNSFDETESSLIGKKIGSYRILREIGQGGMGAVFLAERADGEFISRVAIKIVRLGFDSAEIRRRFLHERQILAGLEHPNIARLLDGGTTADNLPFLVMEYVEGKPLTRFCQTENLSLAERLKLFLEVCRAVSYAHQNLVVHRDLKPSNIFVTFDGTPKLLDFGIAKLLDNQADSSQTQTHFRAFTPDYASPEQIRGGKVTTASDVYSLGILLYELLTEQLPYQLENKSFEEIEHAVLTLNPVRPSSIETKKNPKSKTQNPKSLSGDLDNITLMALRKEPSRRYASVQQFAEDIERYLDNKPILARPNTFFYVAAKFIGRNKIVVIAAFLILLSLIGGIITTTWQARAVRREKEKAESVNAFLEQTLKYSNPILSNLRKNGQETTVNEILDEAARQLESGKFDNSPEIKAELERTVGTTYIGQGKYQQARKHFEQYVFLLKGLYAENDPKMIAGSILWADLLFTKGESGEAEKIYRRYLPLLKNEYQKGGVTAESLANTLNNFAYMRRTQGDSKEAESLFRETLELLPNLSDEERNAVATTRSTLASTIADQGRFDEALKTAREAVEEYEKRGEIDSPNYGFSLNVLGGFLTENGDFTEADAKLREAETIFRRLLSPNALWLGDNLRNQAVLLYQQGKYADAVTRADSALKIYEESFGKHYDNYPTALISKGLSLTQMGQLNEGEKFLREAVKIRTESLSPNHFWTALAKGALGENLTMQKRFDEAEPLLRESFESLQTSQGADNPRTKLAERRLVVLAENKSKQTKN